MMRYACDEDIVQHIESASLALIRRYNVNWLMRGEEVVLVACSEPMYAEDHQSAKQANEIEPNEPLTLGVARLLQPKSSNCVCSLVTLQRVGFEGVAKPACTSPHLLHAGREHVSARVASPLPSRLSRRFELASVKQSTVFARYISAAA